ncbi:unnamed protein product [Auanema sp. JU1783]|nr:unnamed protein product [Auanema sp. JU1783]
MLPRLLLFVFCGVQAIDFIKLACDQYPNLPNCEKVVRRAAPKNPFKERLTPTESPVQYENNEGDYLEEDISLELETTTRPYRKTTVALPRQNLLYTIFPTFQKEKDYRKYCPVNEYTFRVTCLPGKKLRYDLQIFCQEFADTCGVPNINLFPSKSGRGNDGRPIGYGQKQKNGNLGLGKSFGFGLGAIPGFEVVSSQGTDIGNGNLPFFNQIGGMMINSGSQLGALGHKYGNGPARSMNALTHGYPSFGLAGQPTDGDKKLSQEVLRSFGVPNVPGLDKVFKKLSGNRPNHSIKGYEPGYGALNPRAPVALGKTDVDNINLPGGMGDVEFVKGVGFGVGKK